MDGFSTAMIVVAVVGFNTTLFVSLGLYLYRQAGLQRAPDGEPGV